MKGRKSLLTPFHPFVFKDELFVDYVNGILYDYASFY